MLTLLKADHATDDQFVFSTTGRRPVSYHNFRERGFTPAVERAGLAGNGITIHGLRSAAISLYAARGLSLVEVATIMGQRDPTVTWKHYLRLFDRSDVNTRVRAAQASLELDTNT
jgi:integrase